MSNGNVKTQDDYARAGEAAAYQAATRGIDLSSSQGQDAEVAMIAGSVALIPGYGVAAAAAIEAIYSGAKAVAPYLYDVGLLDKPGCTHTGPDVVETDWPVPPAATQPGAARALWTATVHQMTELANCRPYYPPAVLYDGFRRLQERATRVDHYASIAGVVWGVEAVARRLAGDLPPDDALRHFGRPMGDVESDWSIPAWVRGWFVEVNLPVGDWIGPRTVVSFHHVPRPSAFLVPVLVGAGLTTAPAHPAKPTPPHVAAAGGALVALAALAVIKPALLRSILPGLF